MYAKMYTLTKEEREKAISKDIRVSFKDLYYDVLKQLRIYEDRFINEYGRVVLCCDAEHNWRQDEFKHYKEKRVDKKKEDNLDWDQIKEIFQQIKKELIEKTSYIVIEVDNLEGDDIIALTCKLSEKDPKVLIISLDKDLNQLVDDKRIFQFSPMKDDYLEKDYITLKELVLSGDTADGIPNIFSDDDHYVRINGDRARPVTKKIKESLKLSESSIRNYFSTDSDLEKIILNYKRNKKLIDLTQIPKKYEQPYKEKLNIAFNLASKNIDNHLDYCYGIMNPHLEKESNE